MAAAHSEEFLTCSICLELLEAPVALTCGHSFCSACVGGCWDQQDAQGVYSCPQCTETFTPRPVLRKNIMLAELVKKRREMGLRAAPPAGPGDVACDVCTGRKRKAAMSCLQCVASYCETHLQPHYQASALKRHKLDQASTQLQEQMCSQHGQVMELFCCTDQQCICSLCSVDDHRGHETVSAAAQREEKQEELGVRQQEVQQQVRQREEQLEEVQQAVEALNCSAQRALEASDSIFTELIRSMKRRRSGLKEVIRAQQEELSSQAEELLRSREEALVELRRRKTELEQLFLTEDHIHFLKSAPALSCAATPPPAAGVRLPAAPASFGGVGQEVAELREKVEELLEEEWSRIFATVWSEHPGETAPARWPSTASVAQE